MSTTPVESPATALLRETLEQARAQAGEQLEAAWQLHVAMLEQQLRSGWDKHLVQLLDERFAELAGALTTEIEEATTARIQAEVEATVTSERRQATRALAEHLNRAARRLRTAGKQEDWTVALLDSLATLSERAAVFTVQGGSMRLERATSETAPFEIALAVAPAFAGAVETRDPVVASCTPSELSEALLTAFGPAASGRAHLFPVVSQDKTVAVIYAEINPGRADAEALELIASVAGAVWEARSGGPSASLVSIQGLRPRETTALPAWAELPADEQELHLRAQRFARVQVAEIRLYQSAAVKQGRASKTLYGLLKDELERGREAYRQQFIQDCPSMVDYFHVEVVRTLANDDASVLGPDYPGPLV